MSRPTPPPAPKDDFAAVSTYVRSLNEYFKKLTAYIDEQVPAPIDIDEKLKPIVAQLHAVETNSVKGGDKIRLSLRGEAATWMTAGGEIKSRAVDAPEFQYWAVQKQ